MKGSFIRTTIDMPKDEQVKLSEQIIQRVELMLRPYIESGEKPPQNIKMWLLQTYEIMIQPSTALPQTLKQNFLDVIQKAFRIRDAKVHNF